jgi:TRAP-type C4-dicarboxylate transport system substrate-binding protein
MAKFLVLGLIGILIGVLAACGGNGDGGDTGGGGGGGAGQAATVAPTTAPATQAAPEEATKPAVAETTATLKDVAAKLAGGPGAIYAGDVNQLAGAAVDPELGWQPTGGDIPANLLKESEWIYTSDYYNKLLEKANLENPTKLVSSGESFKIQYACINRALFPCKMKEKYFIPNVYERTNGQVDISVVGYPELGIAGPDTISLVANGTLSFAEITGAYVGGDLPVLDMYYFWGLFQDRETDFKAVTAVLEDLDGYIEEATGGGTVVTHNWYAGHDQWFFSREPLNTLGDYEGKRTRSHGTTMSDLINGMGMEAQFVAFAEVYTALERGILDAGVTGSTPGHGQRWYEVTTYLNGPLKSLLSTNNVINADVWDRIPADLQQILIEEGAKAELEQLRLTSIQNVTGVQKNIDAGMELVEFSPELADHSLNVSVVQHVIPGWLRRVGYPEKGDNAVGMFNEHVGPYVGLAIDADGSVSETTVTKGPHAR